MINHTPGPWVYAYGAVYVGTREAVESEERPLSLLRAVRDDPRTTPVERDHNARLAAHAPELLDLLAQVSEHVDDAMLSEQIESVIARARGDD